MEEIELLNDAYEIYNLDDREDLSKQILTYIAKRILANRNYLDQLIQLLDVNISFADIWNAFEEARIEEEYYKKSDTFRKIDSLFVMGVYATSKGNIVVETDNVLEIIKCFVRSIKTRNTITISKLDYNEVSIESVILVIFCEALNKFGLDRNQIMIIPYEECYYENFDEIIVDEDGKKIVEAKPTSNKYIIYIETDSFKEEIDNEIKHLGEKGLEYEVLKGEFYETIRKINNIKPIGASIYTMDSNLGYRFINLVHSNNVFVNSSLLNSEDYNSDNNIYYLRKKIIYPLTCYDNSLDESVEIKPADEKIEENTAVYENKEELNLTIPKANPWYKRIIDAIKKFFVK